MPGEIARFRGVVAELSAEVPGSLVGVERDRLHRRVSDFAVAGAPPDLAAEVAALLDVFSLLDIVEIAQRTDAQPGVVAQLYFTISERYEVDRFLGRITALPAAGSLDDPGALRAAQRSVRGVGRR